MPSYNRLRKTPKMLRLIGVRASGINWCKDVVPDYVAIGEQGNDILVFTTKSDIIKRLQARAPRV